MNNKTFWILIIVIVLVVAAVWFIRPSVEDPTVPDESVPVVGDAAPTEESELPVVEPELGADEISDIESQLEGIDMGDLESEFEQIDEDLQQL